MAHNEYTVPIVFGAHLINIHEWAGLRSNFFKFRSATERPISVKFVLMTSGEGGVHVWVVHLSILLNIHNLNGLSHFVEN